MKQIKQISTKYFKKLEDIHTYEAVLATDSAFKNSLLLVSLMINVTMLVAYMVLQLS